MHPDTPMTMRTDEQPGGSGHHHGNASQGVICVGLGPGDPELMSLKAARLVRQARQVAYFRKAGRAGMARQIVQGLLAPDAVEHAMEYPVTTEIPLDDPAYARTLAAFYDHWCQRLAALSRTAQVVVLCEGDPLLYGSFMHLYVRLRARGDVPLELVPGIPGMVGCWHAAGLPMTWGDDTLAVLPGTLPEQALAQRMREADALVVMKVGRNLPRIRRALAQAGRLEAAWLVEHGTMARQRVRHLLEVPEQESPYFSIVLAPGHGRRPVAQDA